MRFITLLVALLSHATHLLLAQGPRCLLFDGVDDHATADNTAFNTIGTGDFTIEALVNGAESAQAQHAVLLSDRPATGEGLMFFFHDLWGGSSYKMLAIQLGGVNYLLINNGTYNGSLLDGNCHHVAIVRESDTLRFYADGAPIGTRLLNTSAVTTAGTSTLLFGHDPHNMSYFNGDFSQVKVWDHARTDAEVMATHGLAIPASTPGLVGYWPMFEGGGQTLADLAGGAGATLGDQAVDDAADPQWTFNCCQQGTSGGHEGKCMVFDGIDDRLTAPNTALNAIGGNDFTFEATVNANEAAQPQHPVLFSDRPEMGLGTMFFFHGLWGGSNYKMLSVQLDGINYFLIDNGTYNGSLLDGTCHDVAISRAGNILHFYVDGLEIGTRELLTAAPTVAGTSSLVMGHDAPDLSYFNGHIGQVKVWDHARTADEISATHGLALADGTPGLVGYWPMDDGNGQLVADHGGSADAWRGADDAAEDADPTWTMGCCESVSTSVHAVPATTISVFPDPAMDEVNVQLGKAGARVRLLLFDASGRLVMDVQRGQVQRTTLDLRTLPAGLYTLLVQADGERFTARIAHER